MTRFDTSTRAGYSAEPRRCRCRRTVLGRLQPGGRPVLVATFHDGELAAVERRHWHIRDGCPVDHEQLDPHTFVRRS